MCVYSFMRERERGRERERERKRERERERQGKQTKMEGVTETLGLDKRHEVMTRCRSIR